MEEKVLESTMMLMPSHEESAPLRESGEIDAMAPTHDTDQFSSFKTLPADHPLLAKFQATLRAHLTKVTAELEAEIADIDHNMKELDAQRVDVGANLYDLQYEIDRQKETLDSYNSRINETFEKRIQCEETNRAIQSEFKSLKRKHTEAQREHNERVAEMRKLQALELSVKKWHREMRDEVEVSKRVVSKDKQEKMRQSDEKRKMDLVLLNLEMEVQRREAESARLNEQIAERQRVIEELNTSLTEASTDLAAIESEHKRLVSSCNDVIHAIENRDKALATATEKLNEEHEKSKNIQTEIDATKKEAQKEMERNETLEHLKQRLIETVNRLDKQIAKKNQEHEEIRKKIEETSSLIEATDAAMAKTTTESHVLGTELKAKLRDHERQTKRKMELEEKVLEALQDNISSDQASRARARNVRELQNKRRERELIMFSTEEQLSKLMYELEKLKGIVAGNRARMDELMKEKSIVDGKANEYDSELIAVKKSIDSMMREYDVLNKRLAQLIDAAGGTEKSPHELRIADLERSVNEMETEIREKQNTWLRLQNNLVKMAERRTQQLNDIHLARNQLVIIQQKTMKIEKDLAEVDRDDQDLVRDVKNMNTKLDILSTKLFENRQKHESEQQACVDSHSRMTDKLKDSEMAVLRLEEEIRELGNEIEELKAKVMERHREALAWESKWKMVAETKRQRDQEYAKTSEIGIMESEIHRMEVRYSQLKRAQEKLVHDMEISVQHRDHIFDAATLRSKIQKKNSRKSMPPVDPQQTRAKELKSKLKQVIRDTKMTEEELAKVLSARDGIEMELRQINQAIEDERMQYLLMQNEIEETTLLKQENLENIVRLQQRAKRYRNLASAKELPKLRNESIIDDHMDRQMEIIDHLTNVLEGVLPEYPDQKVPINRILHLLKSN